MVLCWANTSGIDSMGEIWIGQLRNNGIGNMDALVKVASSKHWERFLAGLSPFLATELENWYEPASELQKSRSRKRNVEFGEEFVSFAPFKKLKPAIEFASWPGTSDFREVRFSNIPYIDKTGIIYELTRKRHVFLSGLVDLEKLYWSIP